MMHGKLIKEIENGLGNRTSKNHDAAAPWFFIPKAGKRNFPKTNRRRNRGKI